MRLLEWNYKGSHVLAKLFGRGSANESVESNKGVKKLLKAKEAKGIPPAGYGRVRERGRGTPQPHDHGPGSPETATPTVRSPTKP